MSFTDRVHLEGRINAHRRLLVELFSIVAAIPKAREALAAMARDTETVSDHEEDPGVVEPDAAFAAQNIADDEIRAILKAAMARLETRT